MSSWLLGQPSSWALAIISSLVARPLLVKYFFSCVGGTPTSGTPNWASVNFIAPKTSPSINSL